jgi:hypothetical protein
MGLGDVRPKVSVAEAIRIVQLHGSKAQKGEMDRYEQPAIDVAEVRKRLLAKLNRPRERMLPELLSQCWSFDEEHDQIVPPGWVRAS